MSTDMVTLTPRTDLDLRASLDLRDNLAKAIASDQEVLIDMGNVRKVDVALMNSLIVLGRSLRKRRGRLVLKGVQKNVRDIFELAGLSKIVEFE